jgi:hypothetical protein
VTHLYPVCEGDEPISQEGGCGCVEVAVVDRIVQGHKHLALLLDRGVVDATVVQAHGGANLLTERALQGIY